MKLLMFRQGDVLLRQIEQLPNDLKRSCHPIAIDESRHRHRVKGDAVVFIDKTYTKLFVEVKTIAELVHVHANTDIMADHYPIQLPEGFYEVQYQRQYSPFTKFINAFLD